MVYTYRDFIDNRYRQCYIVIVGSAADGRMLNFLYREYHGNGAIRTEGTFPWVCMALLF